MTVDQAEREREDRVFKIANLFASKGSGGKATWDELFVQVFGSVPPKTTKEEREKFETERKAIKSIIAEVCATFGVLIYPSFPPGSYESVNTFLANKDEFGVFTSLVKKRAETSARIRKLEEEMEAMQEEEKESERKFAARLKAIGEDAKKKNDS